MRLDRLRTRQAGRPVPLQLCPIVIVLLAGCHSRPETAQRAPDQIARLRPLNVVVVTVDTLRPDHLRCYGYNNIETPEIDGLAHSRLLFTNAIDHKNVTRPSI